MLPALVYFCWRTSRDGAYLGRGNTARSAALVTGLVAATQAFSAGTLAVRGQWLDDGRAGLFVNSVMVAVAMSLVTMFILRSAAYDRPDE